MTWELDFSLRGTTDAPRLTVRLHPDKPIVNRKHLKSEKHLLHLTYWTTYLSLAYVKGGENTISEKRWQHSTLINKQSFCCLFIPVIACLTGSCPVSQESIIPYIASLGKEQHWKVPSIVSTECVYIIFS